MNPFIIDKPLLPADAIDRPHDAELLLSLVEGGHNACVSAPRRYGKTTLLRQVQESAQGLGFAVVAVDLYGVGSRREIALRLEDGYHPLKRSLARAANRALRRVRLSPGINVGVGKLDVEQVDLEGERMLLDLLDLPLRHAKRSGVPRTLVVLDEFQDVLRAGEGIDGLLRSRIQQHGDRISYVFAGSHPGMMQQLFADRSRPLYGQARQVRLSPLPNPALERYIGGRFEASGRDPGGALERLLRLGDGHPNRAMMLAHHLWEHTKPGAPADDAEWDAAVEAVFMQVGNELAGAWEAVEEPEREALCAIAHGNVPLLGGNAGERHEAYDGARHALAARGDIQIDGRGVERIVDPLYAEWIRGGNRPPERTPTQPSAALQTSEFGSVDGSRADLGELDRGFVSLDSPYTSGLSVASGDLRARVIVGRKGSGKTTYLRRWAAAASRAPDIYVAGRPGTIALSSRQVGKLAAWFGSGDADVWRSCWRQAILWAVASHILNAPQLRGHLADGRATEIGQLCARLGPAPAAELTPDQALDAMIARWQSREQAAEDMSNPTWEVLAKEIARATRALPPICFYMDALDEEFYSAPKEWTTCQVGLFLAVMSMLRQNDLSRIHVVIAIRDVVMATLFSSEHATRYVNSAHIRWLEWTPSTLRDLLDAKVARLPADFRMRPELAPNVYSWLGLSEILERDRNAPPQDVGDYIVEWTRQTPRDVILIGNVLSGMVSEARQQGRSLHASEVRAAIQGVALTLTREQLAISGVHIAASALGEQPPVVTFGDAYPGDHDRLLSSWTTDLLREELAGLRTDSPSREELMRIAAKLGHADEVLSILWQDRVLGWYDATGEKRFFASVHDDTRRLPSSPHGHCVHPVIASGLGLRRGAPHSPGGA